jgi:hypothetical protein
MSTVSKDYPIRYQQVATSSRANTATVNGRTSTYAYGGVCIDHGPGAQEPCEVCPCCILRYHFLIESTDTDDYLWIGSTCITKFFPELSYAVEEDLKRMDKAAKKAERQRKKAAKEAKQRSEKEALQRVFEQGVAQLQKAEDATNGRVILCDYYRRKKSLSPAQADLVVKILGNNGGPVPLDVQVNFALACAGGQLMDMGRTRADRLYASLNPVQQRDMMECARRAEDE